MAKKKGNDQNTELVKKGSNLPAAAQDFFDPGYTGFEQVNDEMIKIPFLKVATKGSPQIDEDEDAYIKGLKRGMFFNSFNNTKYGASLKMVILSTFQSFVEWMPNRGGFVSSMTPEEFAEIKSECTYSKEKGAWINEAGNEIKNTINFYVFLPDFPEEGTILFPMSGASITAAKNWVTDALSITQNKKKVPSFGVVWVVETAKKENDKGSWNQAEVFNVDSFVWEDTELAPKVLKAKDFVKTIAEKQVDFSAMQEKKASPFEDDGDFEDL